MPEIYEMFYGLSHLFRLFAKVDRDFNQKLEEFELQAQEEMAYNRLKLYGLESDFENV